MQHAPLHVLDHAGGKEAQTVELAPGVELDPLAQSADPADGRIVREGGVIVVRGVLERDDDAVGAFRGGPDHVSLLIGGIGKIPHGQQLAARIERLKHRFEQPGVPVDRGGRAAGWASASVG